MHSVELSDIMHPVLPIIVYTDGGCQGNPGPGAWAFVMRYGDRLKEASGFDPATTNNKMELSAVIEALSFLASRRGEVLPSSPSWLNAPIIVFTDSQYVKNGITKWIRAWKAKGWKTSGKEPVKNRELWERLDSLAEGLRPEFRWVEGHAGIEDNERCDRLVRHTMESRRPLA